ncbi:DUF2269 domain-containing protein [Corynebacterium sp. TAE3-ERU12]|uniref:DUF2269 domain-containing protein n=1 Tax=Corynebacterium sp. TAE3-ERU12 TaxID=2849491 RepID=UPI001C45715E|nr:DUF2269 domain-containing protein [Corynebacterium sp. TAE3-ERU12]MBV7295083.1 DUF2269 domain-containing protein [Corynebacterium sp. TAE3-ERU12]
MNLIQIAHVVAAILLIGPVTVATSIFPRTAAAAHAGDQGTLGAARVLYGISRTYGIISLAVPLLGVGLAFTDVSLYFTNGIVHASILGSIIAWALLFFVILPRQRVMLAGLGIAPDGEEADDPDLAKLKAKAAELDWQKAKGQLAMFSGLFALIWLVIAVLMFYIS